MGNGWINFQFTCAYSLRRNSSLQGRLKVVVIFITWNNSSITNITSITSFNCAHWSKHQKRKKGETQIWKPHIEILMRIMIHAFVSRCKVVMKQALEAQIWIIGCPSSLNKVETTVVKLWRNIEVINVVPPFMDNIIMASLCNRGVSLLWLSVVCVCAE